MSIELHCPKCMKLIRAPDAAGGKHGKCPYCEAKVYVPTPPDDTDEIPVAPLDEELDNQEELRREAARYAATLDKERENPRAGAGTGATPRPAAPPPQEVPGEVIDVPAGVEAFVLAMKDSKLDEAEKVVARLQRAKSRAKDYVEGLFNDPTPPSFGDVPKPLVQGFLKALLQRLS